MKEELSRLSLLIGEGAVEKLQTSHIAVFGIGGVGGHCAEALVRSAIGQIDIIDSDVVSPSNINRQIIALHSTIGKNKVDVMKSRLLDINPNLKINVFKTFYTKETKDEFDFSKYDYVIDAIDTVSGKISLVEECYQTNTPIISAMGAGNKMFPELFEIEDIYKTSVCPLARVMRQELKKRNIQSLKVVYSKEKAIKPKMNVENSVAGKTIPGSNAFTPAVMGLIIAGEVIKDLIK